MCVCVCAKLYTPVCGYSLIPYLMLSLDNVQVASCVLQVCVVSVSCELSCKLKLHFSTHKV